MFTKRFEGKEKNKLHLSCWIHTLPLVIDVSFQLSLSPLAAQWRDRRAQGNIITHLQEAKAMRPLCASVKAESEPSEAERGEEEAYGLIFIASIDITISADLQAWLF